MLSSGTSGYIFIVCDKDIFIYPVNIWGKYPPSPIHWGKYLGILMFMT